LLPDKSFQLNCHPTASRSLKLRANNLQTGVEIMRRLFFAIMLVALAQMTARPQTANLSGTWRLNVSKSFMGMEHPFSNYELTKKIDQAGENISITDTAIHNSNVNIPLPDSSTSMQVATDGKEHLVQVSSSNRNQPESNVPMTATWQAGTLELVQNVTGLANMTKHRIFLSGDGSQLIDLVEGHNIYGDSEQRLVFDKVP
jgi:hypothetical protein